MRKWYLYYIKDSENIVWVGISMNPEKRFINHIYPDNNEPNKKKVEWAKSLKKRCIKPSLVIIDEFNSKKDALKIEREHTLKLRKNNTLLNIYDGCIPDIENRKKLSIINTGKKHSEETKKKLSIFFKQEKYADAIRNIGLKTSKKIIDNNGIIYSSITNAAKETGCHRVNIGNVLSGKFKQIKGFTFKYV